ncbi:MULTISPECIES: hypothetical protein [unclassified Amycolatopsis]|uniref:hypothetical protein n=1 Tax=unclassified Amycolatopsis TaxID=2618356 RepID=UPI001C6A0BE6|nr:hypothetical protein [Amycolatopsis sp. DSM 110486]QYN22071.1 hypothetical protein K1T34_06090 [Amycolatopsis sp. DSM 110486]
MSPRAIVAFVSVAAIVIGVFLSLRGLIGGPDFVTPAGAACDPAFAWQDDSLGDCFAVERHSPAFALVLAHIGLLGLIYARLLMTRKRKLSVR